MERERIFLLLKENPLFKKLSDNEINQIISVSTVNVYEKGSPLVQEGEIKRNFHVILQGSAEVKQQDQESTLKAGETIEEMALFGDIAASRSVRASEESEILSIPVPKIKEQKELFFDLILSVSRVLSERLRKTGETTVRSLQAEIEGASVRIEMGRFLFIGLVLLSLWIFLIALAKDLMHIVKSPFYLSFTMIGILTLVFISHVFVSIYPKSYYGLNLNKWKKGVFEGIVFTLPILGLAVVFKWVLITYVPEFQGKNLFEHITSSNLLISGLYVLLTPLQEFLARGCIQSSIKASISGAHTGFWAIVLSNLIFAAFHAQLSPAFSIAAFCGGLFWGWLYNRQWSLVSPIISHALIGGWCLSVLGFGSIFLGR